MQQFTRRIVAIAGAVAIGFGAAACSEGDAPSTTSTTTSTTTTAQAAPAAAAILQKARTNALAAKSGAFRGQIEQSGERMMLAFKGTSDGKTADIAIEMGVRGKVRVISVPGGVYLQADAVFWKAQGAPEAFQKAGGKFVKAPTSAASITDDLSLRSFLRKAFEAVTADQVADEVGQETIDGIDVWVLTDKKGKGEGSLYISKDKFEVVRFTGSAKSPGQLDFSAWNADQGITAPPADQIMSIG